MYPKNLLTTSSIGASRLEQKDSTARKIARFVTDKFWAPVGQGSLAKRRTQYLVSTLFARGEGRDVLEAKVTHRVRQLPGFEDISKFRETIEEMSRNPPVSFEAALP
jgi:hypothetical protein